MNKSRFLFSTFFLLLLTYTYGQSKQDKQLAKALDQILSGQFKPTEPGGALLIAKKGEVVYEKGFGLANLEWNVPINPNTVFQIGSITKLFTALAILQLSEKQKLSLQDSIQKFIPGFPAKEHTITIEHLLTHSSGIKDFMTLDHPDPFVLRKDLKAIEVINFFKNEPLIFTPGTKSSYSNSGYFLLGYIIEAASGLSYGQYIAENIFKPSGMNNSYYGDNAVVIPNRANSYSKEGNLFKNGDYRSMSIPYSAGAILSTVEDLFKWHQALYNNKLLKKETLLKAFTAFQLKDGTKGDFGYGWMVNYQVDGSPALVHSGGISGFNSLFIYLPNEDVLVVLFSNLREAKVQETATNAALLAVGKKLPDETLIDNKVLQTYKGKYQMASDTSRIALIKELEGRLIIEILNESKAELSATTQVLFRIKNIKPAATLEFAKDGTGKVIKFIVNQGGVYEWKKID